ncbi:MAG: FAD/NAD(P)-binding protein [Rickettsiales bacterium]
MKTTLSAPTVVIVGGGFSGVAVAAHVIRKTPPGTRLFVVEKSANLAKGVAYSTPEPFHLLNVPAKNMGLYEGESEHFLSWLASDAPSWRDSDPAFRSLAIDGDAFYPRKLYGVYLEQIWKRILAEAKAKGAEVTALRDEARDVEITERRTAIVSLRQGVLPEADRVVLAVGSVPVKALACARGAFLCPEKYVDDMWAPPPESLMRQKDLSRFSERSRAVIAGSGLSMADAFLSLRAKGFKGHVTAISRHGLIPHPHRAFAPYPRRFDPSHFPQDAVSLAHFVRREAEAAMARGADWRAVWDRFRPETNAVWERLPVKEKRRIAQRLLPFWNAHRHRIPSHVLDSILADKERGAFSIVAGTIYHIGGKRDEKITVSYRKKKEDAIETLRADCVVNCSGPEIDIAYSRNPFLLKLRDKKIINSGALRMGIELTKEGRAKGRAPDIFHAVGAIAAGERLESTSVPDIRRQAAETADGVLFRGEDRDYSRYYNYFI